MSATSKMEDFASLLEESFAKNDLAEGYVAKGIITAIEKDVAIIDVEGQLVVSNRQDLKQRVLDEVEKGTTKVLVDFARAGYIDSSGLGVLVSLAKRIRESGGDLRLANLNEDLQTLFELTKLDTLFQISETRDGALASF